MSNPVTLKGMAWDHPRARNPLNAVSAEWSRTSGAQVTWDARPLKAFEDQALEELARNYDLVLIDHPFTQTAAGSGLILPVEAWADGAYLEDQKAHSVGPSYASYTWAGKQWALAIDAACQVSAVREDLRQHSGIETLPDTWAEVSALAQSLRNQGAKVAVPMNPNHSYCAFISVGVSLAGEAFWLEPGLVDRAAGQEALEFLRHLGKHLHRDSQGSDPIEISDRMSSGGEILYVPLMFGYSSYARKGFRQHPLRFGAAPSGPSGRRGSVLGGVGLTVSARSAHAALAADLARTIGSREIQSTLYVDSGGQPGHGRAWTSAQANQQVHGFFSRTLGTMEQAFIRPRVHGHRQFQPLAGELVHRYVWQGDMSTGDCLQEFDRLCEQHLYAGR